MNDRLRRVSSWTTHEEAPADRNVRVLIVDAQRLSGELLAATVSGHAMEVVGVVTSAAEAVRAAKDESPDLVIVDLEHPDGAVALGQRLMDLQPQAKVVALSTGEDHTLASEAVKVGFHGCVTRDVTLTRFFGAISSALNGEVVISDRLAGRRSPDARRAKMLADSLTLREREILELLVLGKSSGEISKELSISANTVRTHVSSILSKLQVHSRLEAVTFATRHRLVQPSVIRL